MYFYGIFLTILIGAANAAVDCSKRPSFMDVKSCCKIPKPDFSSFQAQCSGQKIPTQRAPSPCYLECVFNATDALDGDNLNMPNARTMIESLYAGAPDFAEAYIIGLEKCAPVVSQHIAEFKGRKVPLPKGPNMPNCPLRGTYYAMCAHKHVFIGCPPSAWTSTPACEQTKEYATSCEASGGPVGRRGGGPRGTNQRNQRNRGRRDVAEDGYKTDPKQTNKQGRGRRNRGQERSGQGIQEQRYSQGQRHGQRQGQRQG